MKSRGPARGASRILILVSGVVAALLLGAAAPAWAGTLDQQQTDADSNLGLVATQAGAQTFTAGITGQLDEADLELSKVGSPSAPVTVEVRTTDQGAPTAEVLATGTIDTSLIGKSAAFVPVTFATPAEVAAGTQYALVAYAPGSFGSAAGWLVKTTGDPYAGGQDFFSGDAHPPGTNWGPFPSADFAFKTFVVPAPPEPPPPPEPPAAPSSPAGQPATPAPSGTGQRAAALRRCKQRAKKLDWSKQRLKKCKTKARLLPV